MSLFSFEEEIRNLSYPEAPEIITKKIPGPRAKEFLSKVYDLETVTLLAPYVIPFVWCEARGRRLWIPMETFLLI
ncbi:MAG: hypothetical protein QXS79_05435 [Candidatus Bathyarchaeia archaeon]